MFARHYLLLLIVTLAPTVSVVFQRETISMNTSTSGNSKPLLYLLGTALFLCFTSTAKIASASSATLTRLLSFGQGNGALPAQRTSLVQGFDGNLYGTTFAGGPFDCGRIFKLTPAGVLNKIFTFKELDGCGPVGLVLGTDGNFYGTTAHGGVHGFGTVFRITPGGSLALLHSFNGIDGANPRSALVQGRDGNFYGTTKNGGTGLHGSIFVIGTSGTFTSLYSFAGETYGANPIAALVPGVDGTLYGTTMNGGVHGLGTVGPTPLGIPFAT